AVSERAGASLPHPKASAAKRSRTRTKGGVIDRRREDVGEAPSTEYGVRGMDCPPAPIASPEVLRSSFMVHRLFRPPGVFRQGFPRRLEGRIQAQGVLQPAQTLLLFPVLEQ